MPSPLGHALAGAATYWLADAASSRDRPAPIGVFGCAILAAAADLDWLFNSHRTGTHSIGAVFLVAVFTAALVGVRGGPWRRTSALAAGAYGTHLLLDWVSLDGSAAGGFMAFWPFSDRYVKPVLEVFLAPSFDLWAPRQFVAANAAYLAREIVVLGPLVLAAWLWHVRRRRSGYLVAMKGDAADAQM